MTKGDLGGKKISFMPQYLREGVERERERGRVKTNGWIESELWILANAAKQSPRQSQCQPRRWGQPERDVSVCVCVPSKRWTRFIDVNWIILGGGWTRGKRKDLICVMDQSALNYCQHSWEHLVYLLFLPSSSYLIFCYPVLICMYQDQDLPAASCVQEYREDTQGGFETIEL